jgi:hypothetical protein
MYVSGGRERSEETSCFAVVGGMIDLFFLFFLFRRVLMFFGRRSFFFFFYFQKYGLEVGPKLSWHKWFVIICVIPTTLSSPHASSHL